MHLPRRVQYGKKTRWYLQVSRTTHVAMSHSSQIWKSDLPELFEGMVHGDLVAGERLWRLVESRLSAIVRKTFRLSDAEVERIVAEAFESLWLHASDRVRDPWRYLISTCYRRALSCFRVTRVAYPCPDDVPERLPASHHEREVDCHDQLQSWLRARGELSLRMLELTALGRDPEEIAGILGLSAR